MPVTALCLIADRERAPLPEARVAALAHALGAERRVLAPGAAVELLCPGEPDAGLVRDHLADAALDIAAVPAGPGRRKKLLVSDMDSTIITIECIDELAAYAGVGPMIADVTRRTMNGELEFSEALRARVALLAGLPETVVDDVIRERLRLMPGAATLVRTMRAHGARTVLVSGGFTLFTRRVREDVGFDDDEANTLELRDGRLTGRVLEPVRGPESKLAALRREVGRLGRGAEAALAVGDGANDLPMIQAAGLGIAFRPHPRVAAASPIVVRHADLRALLYLQGYAEEDLVGGYASVSRA